MTGVQDGGRDRLISHLVALPWEVKDQDTISWARRILDREKTIIWHRFSFYFAYEVCGDVWLRVSSGCNRKKTRLSGLMHSKLIFSCRKAHWAFLTGRWLSFSTFPGMRAPAVLWPCCFLTWWRAAEEGRTWAVPMGNMSARLEGVIHSDSLLKQYLVTS